MTKASTFVRSWLGFSNKFYDYFFHDCFITIEPEKLIHIILKMPSNDEERKNKYNEIKEKLITHEFFSNIHKKEQYETFDFTIPYRLEQDFDNFVKGKYSKLSDSAKELILMSHEDMENIRNLAVILYPEKRHRDKLSEMLGDEIPPDAEVYDKPDIIKELLPKNNN